MKRWIHLLLYKIYFIKCAIHYILIFLFKLKYRYPVNTQHTDNQYPKPDWVRFNLYSIQFGFGSESVPVQLLQFRPNGNITDPSLKHEKREVIIKQVHFSVVLLIRFKKARRTNYWMETEHVLFLFVAHDLGRQFVSANTVRASFVVVVPIPRISLPI